MSASALAENVGEALAVDADRFADRARAEAAALKDEVRDGTFDNAQAIVGLELELYAVDDRTGALRRVPRQLLELIGFEKELGLHNAEMQTSPQPLSSYGLVAQAAELRANLEAALEKTAAEDIRLVADGLWTVPPTGRTASDYLADSVEEDGIRIATNMSDSVRYHAMANTSYPSGLRIEAPNVTLATDTVMPESLTTSIQPHYQVPHAPDLPAYFKYALRIAAPLLALGVNSPLFPPDLYDDVPADQILAEAHMEHRIDVFESVLNPTDGTSGKVRFPPDFETVDAAIDDIAADDCIVPMDIETGHRFDDQFAHFRHKHGSYWRWVRPVFDGATRSAANARIEFRPLPGQPTVRDAVAFQAVFAGLMESLWRQEHPIAGLDWETARENFYAAAHDGIRADIEWITADGVETTKMAVIGDDLLAFARDGLEFAGLTAEAAERYVAPIATRLDAETTPARWKHDRVAAAVDEGTPLAEAIWEMQAAYVDRQRDSLIDGCFTDWLA